MQYNLSSVTIPQSLILMEIEQIPVSVPINSMEDTVSHCFVGGGHEASGGKRRGK